MSKLKAATAFVDKQALQHNLALIKSKAPASRVLAVIKANAYGHGVIQVARSLENADAFGVARIEEAVKLRESGIDKPILLLEGFYDADELRLLSRYNLETVIHNVEQLLAIDEQSGLSEPLKVWLKIDSGMHRLGIDPEQLPYFLERIEICDKVQKPIRFISHFACADELDNPATSEQVQRFLTSIKGLEGERSIAASAGILKWPESHMEWNRPGIILYGVSPFDFANAEELGFLPVMTLKSKIISIKTVRKGEPVGYGASWITERDTNVAVIAIGYGDGYPRTAPYGTPVWINGRKVPVAGRVSMDMLTVDLGPDSQDKVGDEATLWGRELPVEEVAKHVGTIGYELVTRLTSRVELSYVECD
ncbi:alanine racemase [Vibrio hannami]|uniref:alanine racemase n=1 Tax=Vibrio hannami TaxID=2717094 RepID=UPI00240F0703|nr:alanine racemase [Vibrio hannami]MDG3084714.1 alanine racemase [Vibrio hannami]